MTSVYAEQLQTGLAFRLGGWLHVLGQVLGPHEVAGCIEDAIALELLDCFGGAAAHPSQVRVFSFSLLSGHAGTVEDLIQFFRRYVRESAAWCRVHCLPTIIALLLKARQAAHRIRSKLVRPAGRS
ncbi:MAG: hypothetical protein K2X00_19110 [Nitrospiraceae bacterium]|nr:hypothetical protein [Nitrospiraceae bacterium]